MTSLSLAAIGLGMGVIFGFALEKSKMFEPRALIRQMQLKNFLMLKVFMTAMLTSAIVILAMTHYGYATLHVKGFNWLENSIGGLILGAGIVLSGACPGTVFVQIGAGYKDAIFVFLGGLAGAFIYGVYEPTLQTLYDASETSQTVMSWLNISHTMVVGGFAVIALIILLLLEARTGWKTEINQVSES